MAPRGHGRSWIPSASTGNDVVFWVSHENSSDNNCLMNIIENLRTDWKHENWPSH